MRPIAALGNARQTSEILTNHKASTGSSEDRFRIQVYALSDGRFKSETNA